MVYTVECLAKVETYCINDFLIVKTGINKLG